MQNNLKCSFIMFAVFSAFVIGWQTISNNAIFSGVGVPFVALLLILGALTFMLVTNKDLRHRILDLYIIACVFVLLEFIVYFVLEFSLGNNSTWHGFNIFQNVLCVFGIVYFAYIIFRSVYEAKGWSCSFIEVVLGNKKPVKKVKQSKEFANGSLEAKPNQVHQEEQNPQQENSTQDVEEQNISSNEVKTETPVEQEGEE